MKKGNLSFSRYKSGYTVLFLGQKSGVVSLQGITQSLVSRYITLFFPWKHYKPSLKRNTLFSYIFFTRLHLFSDVSLYNQRWCYSWRLFIVRYQVHKALKIKAGTFHEIFCYNRLCYMYLLFAEILRNRTLCDWFSRLTRNNCLAIKLVMRFSFVM